MSSAWVSSASPLFCSAAGALLFLLECFLWKTSESALDRRAIEEELADLLITATNLAQRIDVDLMAAVERKLALNAERYPVAKARGRADKHTDL